MLSGARIHLIPCVFKIVTSPLSAFTFKHYKLLIVTLMFKYLNYTFVASSLGLQYMIESPKVTEQLAGELH